MKKGLDYYSVIYLLVSWAAIRFLLVGIHGMKGRPDILAVAGAAVIAVSFSRRMRLTSRFASMGYFVSFLASYLLRSRDGAPGMMRIVWGVIYAVIIRFGLYSDSRLRKGR